MRCLAQTPAHRVQREGMHPLWVQPLLPCALRAMWERLLSRLECLLANDVKLAHSLVTQLPLCVMHALLVSLVYQEPLHALRAVPAHTPLLQADLRARNVMQVHSATAPPPPLQTPALLVQQARFQWLAGRHNAQLALQGSLQRLEPRYVRCVPVVPTVARQRQCVSRANPANSAWTVERAAAHPVLLEPSVQTRVRHRLPLVRPARRGLLQDRTRHQRACYVPQVRTLQQVCPPASLVQRAHTVLMVHQRALSVPSAHTRL